MGYLPCGPDFCFCSLDSQMIGTPNGIIPFSFATSAKWKEEYGGDYHYYKDLSSKLNVTFIDTIFYKVITRGCGI
jgi:hypothetical protein